jgi:hypothetical protein
MVHWTISFAFGKIAPHSSALNSDGVLKLSSGKKKHVLLKPT